MIFFSAEWGQVHWMEWWMSGCVHRELVKMLLMMGNEDWEPCVEQITSFFIKNTFKWNFVLMK